MEESILNEDGFGFVEKDGLKYIQFANFKKFHNIITHGFTTRIGGVSVGECSQLNLGFNRNDVRENVEENYRRISAALGIDLNNMVFSNQVHDSKVKAVDENDRGKGIVRKSDIIGYDGLMTNKREVALVTFYADCVPVFFLDPAKKVIAIAHSGWRGTVKEIAKETIKSMQKEYGCEIENIEAAIGPSIGQCCFEVGDEVYFEFLDKLPWSSSFCSKHENGKWYIDLKAVIRETLLYSGVKTGKINTCTLCTKCNNDIFFSHRGDMGKTGSMAAITQLV